MAHGKDDAALVNDFLSANGRDLCHGLTLLLTNVTEPTVVSYALARIEYLLPGMSYKSDLSVNLISCDRWS